MIRVVITGMGCVSPLGNAAPTFWNALIAGQSGISHIDKIDTSALRNARGGQVRDFDWSLYGEEGDCDEAAQFAVASAIEATQQANLNGELLRDTSLVLGTNFGGAASWEMTCEMLGETPIEAPFDSLSPDLVDAELWRQATPEDAARFIANRLQLRGRTLTLSNACSSGGHALGVGCDWLRLGRAQRVLCGGFDGLGLSSLAGLSILRTISPDECRPFDAGRNGTLFGEGAAVLLLETLESAQSRGAQILAEVLGHSVNNNAHHLTAPDKNGRGLETVMRRALNNADLSPDKIGYINAHGTGTQLNDLAETQAIKQVLGSGAYEVPVSSIKAATSHIMGGAGALEAIATVFALQQQKLPPTLNFQTPDPQCDLDYVPNTAREHSFGYALSNSSGIGGNNASVVLGKWDG